VTNLIRVMENRVKTLVVTLISVLVLALAGAIYIVFSQKKVIEQQNTEIGDITAVMEFEKQQSIEEIEEMQKQYEDYYINTDNDSLLKLIDEEKQKVQQLLQELKTVKATNHKRITELKQELTTVRGVLKEYIAKVDSLNEVNNTLRNENQQVRRQYTETNKQLKEKTEQAQELDKKVTMAAILEASNIRLSTLNEKGKPTNTLRKITKLQIDFNILRNITAERGRKTIYVRITDSSENLLPTTTKNVFLFEGMNIEYSTKKDFDFTGETQPLTIWFPLQKSLKEGVYTIAIFTDGNLIGQNSFRLE